MISDDSLAKRALHATTIGQGKIDKLRNQQPEKYGSQHEEHADRGLRRML